MIYQLPNPIDVLTPLGDCTAIMIIDYGIDVNTVWVCRFPGGHVKHIYSDDIRIYDNPMNGKGWDVKPFETINKLPPGARRNTDFLKQKPSWEAEQHEIKIKEMKKHYNDLKDDILKKGLERMYQIQKEARQKIYCDDIPGR